jgi:hypothetical protein
LLPHEVVVEMRERALGDRWDETEAASVLVGSALNDDDREFVEHWCMEVGMRAVSGSPLLGLAGLCLGHTARRFGRLSDEALALAASPETAESSIERASSRSTWQGIWDS